MRERIPLPKPNRTEEKLAKKRQADAIYKELTNEMYRIHGRGCWNRRCISAMLRRPPSVHPEHILPRGREGRIDTRENLMPLCNLCNDATANGSKTAFGREMTGDEVKLMILEQHEKEPGFIHWAEIEYVRTIVAKQTEENKK